MLQRLSELEIENYSLPDEQDVRGWDIIDPQDNVVGEVDDLLVDRESGAVPYVIADVGGLFGIGTDTCVIPMQALAAVSETEELRISRSAEQMKEAPSFDEDDELTDGYFERVASFYQVPAFQPTGAPA